ncbi:hypothetical protein HYW84_00605 [Candidatus Peregrinibacteria bacterium]|nr:hypothetical protein [Candidatus Peregrinibacteria bacterium]
MKKLIICILAVCIILIAWYTLPEALGLWAVWDSPQYVELTKSPMTIVRDMRVNGALWSMSGSVQTTTLGAKPHLGGVGGFGLQWYSSEGKFKRAVGFNLFFPPDTNPTLVANSFFVSQDDLTVYDWTPEEKYGTNLQIEDCEVGGLPYKNYDEYPKVRLLSLGPVTVKQEYKHLTFSGSFKMPEVILPRDPYMLCKDGKMIRNPAPPATVSIGGERLDRAAHPSTKRGCLPFEGPEGLSGPNGQPRHE